MADREKFPDQQTSYRFLLADSSIADVARRYRTTEDAIWIASEKRIRKWKFVDKSTFLSSVKAGDSIVLPIPAAELAWEWERYRPTESTLDEVCVKRNTDKLRTGMPPLTPASLWSMALNASFREWNLAHARNPVEADKYPERINILADSVLMIPYPVRPLGGAIAAVPVSTSGAAAGGAMVTVKPVPDWVHSLWEQHLLPMKDLILDLRLANQTCIEVQTRCAAECYHLSVLAELLTMLIASPDNSVKSRADLTTLKAGLAELQRAAAASMAMNPAEFLEPASDAKRRQVAADLLKAMRDGLFNQLCEQAYKEPDEDMNGSSLRGQVSSTQKDAIYELARSPDADGIIGDMKAALARMGAAQNGVPVAGPTALATLLSLVGGGTTVATSAVGNLPGPWSLSLACVQLVTLTVLPAAMRNPSVATSTATDLIGYLSKAAGFTQEETFAFTNALRSGDHAGLAPFNDRISSVFQSSRGWTSSMLLINALGLLITVEVDDTIYARKVINIIGGSVNTGLAAIQIIASFAPATGTFSKAFALFGPGFGVVSGITTILSGAISVYEGFVNDDQLLELVGALQVTGGMVSIAGFLLVIPVLQVAGVVIVVASVGVSLWPVIKDMDNVPDIQKVYLAQLQAFHDSQYFKPIAAKVPSLLEVHDRHAAAAKAADCFFPLPRTTEVQTRLKSMGFKPDDVIRLIGSASSAMPVFLPSGMPIPI